jgi:hypothetical protein
MMQSLLPLEKFATTFTLRLDDFSRIPLLAERRQAEQSFAGA